MKAAYCHCANCEEQRHRAALAGAAAEPAPTKTPSRWADQIVRDIRATYRVDAELARERVGFERARDAIDERQRENDSRRIALREELDAFTREVE